MIGGRWKRRSMALNISLRRERSNVGRSDGLTAGRSEVAPRTEDGSCDFVEAHRTFQYGCKRRFPMLRRRLGTVEENRAVLQEGIPFSHLGRADELLAPNHELAANGGREASGRPAVRPPGRRENRIDAE